MIALHAENWKDSGRTAAIWESSLRRYAFPRLGHRLVSDITVADVMAVLVADDFWNHKRETAKKIRRRISTIMRLAVAQGYRDDNPAGEALGAGLPKSTKPVNHHRALPHAAVAGALKTVRGSGAGIATKLAIEFLTLTATRSSEVRLGIWSEVDFEEAVWRVPAERAKTKRTHEVPLSGRTVAILAEAREITDGSGLIFPSPRGKALSDNTISKLFRELGIDAVPHGARSSFRSWFADSACNRFIYVDNLMEAGADKENGEVASPAAAKKEPPSKAVKIIARAIEDSDDDGWANLGGVGSRILGAAPDFNARPYGCPNLSTLVAKSGGFDIRKGPGAAVHIRRKEAGRNEAPVGG